MHQLKYSDPDKIVGKQFRLIFDAPPGSGIEIPNGKIIGVVKDFHLQSLKSAVEPLVFFKRPISAVFLIISLSLFVMNFLRIVSNRRGPEKVL